MISRVTRIRNTALAWIALGAVLLAASVALGLGLGGPAGQDLLPPDSFLSGLVLAVQVTQAFLLSLALGIAAAVILGWSRLTAMRPLGRSLLLAIPALWGSFALGAFLAFAAGPAVDWRGLVRLELGAPINVAEDYRATCTSPVGQPDALHIVTAPGRPDLFLIPEGEDGPYYGGWNVQISGMEFSLDDPFYPVTVIRATLQDLSGTITFQAERSPDWINPQPYHAKQFEFVISWDCTKPS